MQLTGQRVNDNVRPKVSKGKATFLSELILPQTDSLMDFVSDEDREGWNRFRANFDFDFSVPLIYSSAVTCPEPRSQGV